MMQKQKLKACLLAIVGVACMSFSQNQLALQGTYTALNSLDMPWHQIVDAQKIPLSSYNITAIPHLILFAPDGTILKRGLRGEQIYTTIKQILSDK